MAIVGVVWMAYLRSPVYSTQHTATFNISKIWKQLHQSTFTASGQTTTSFGNRDVLTDLWATTNRCLNSGECVVVTLTTDSGLFIARLVLEGDQPTYALSWTTGINISVFPTVVMVISVTIPVGAPSVQVNMQAHGFDL